jgi:hypothetical protein
MIPYPLAAALTIELSDICRILSLYTFLFASTRYSNLSDVIFQIWQSSGSGLKTGCARHPVFDQGQGNLAGSRSVAMLHSLSNSCIYKLAISGLSMMITFSSLFSVALLEKLKEPLITI